MRAGVSVCHIKHDIMNKMKVYILICCLLATFVNCLAISFPNIVRLKAGDTYLVNKGNGVEESAFIDEKTDSLASMLWYVASSGTNTMTIRSLYLKEDGQYITSGKSLQAVASNLSKNENVSIDGTNYVLDVVDVKPYFEIDYKAAYDAGIITDKKKRSIETIYEESYLIPIKGDYIDGLVYIETTSKSNDQIDKTRGNNGIINKDGKFFIFCKKLGEKKDYNNFQIKAELTNHMFDRFDFLQSSLLKNTVNYGFKRSDWFSDSTKLATSKYVMLKDGTGKYIVNKGNGFIGFADALITHEDSLAGLWRLYNSTKNYQLVFQSMVDAQHITSYGDSADITTARLMDYSSFKVNPRTDIKDNQWYDIKITENQNYAGTNDRLDHRQAFKNVSWQAYNVSLAPEVSLPTGSKFEFGADTLVRIEGYNLFDSVRIVSVKEKVGGAYTRDISAESGIVWRDSVPYLKIPTAEYGERDIQVTLRNTHYDYYYDFNDQSDVEKTSTLRYKVNLPYAVVRIVKEVDGVEYCAFNNAGTLDTAVYIEDEYASYLWYAEKKGTELTLRSLALTEDGRYLASNRAVSSIPAVFASVDPTFSLDDGLDATPLSDFNGGGWRIEVIDVRPHFVIDYAKSCKMLDIQYSNLASFLLPIKGNHLSDVEYSYVPNFKGNTKTNPYVNTSYGEDGLLNLDGKYYLFQDRDQSGSNVPNTDPIAMQLKNNKFVKFDFLPSALTQTTTEYGIERKSQSGKYAFVNLKDNRDSFIVNRGNGVIEFASEIITPEDSLAALWRFQKASSKYAFQSMVDAQYLTSFGSATEDISLSRLLDYRGFNIDGTAVTDETIAGVAGTSYTLSISGHESTNCNENTFTTATWTATNVDLRPNVSIATGAEFPFGRDTLVRIEGYNLFDSVRIVSVKEKVGGAYTLDISDESGIVWRDSVPYLKIPTLKLGSRTISLKLRNTYYDTYFEFKENADVERTITLNFNVVLANAIVRIEYGGKSVKNTGDAVNTDGFGYEEDSVASFLWYMELNGDKTKFSFRSLRTDQEGKGKYLCWNGSATSLCDTKYEYDIQSDKTVKISGQYRTLIPVSVAPELPYAHLYDHRPDGLAFKATDCFLMPVEGAYVTAEVDSIKFSGKPTAIVSTDIDFITLRDTAFVRIAPAHDGETKQTKFDLTISLRNTRFDRLFDDPEVIKVLTTSTTKLVIRRSVFPQSNVGNIDITFENIRNEAGEYLMDFGDHTGYKATLENSADSLAALWRIQDYNDVTDKGHVYGYSFQSMRGTHYITGLFYGDEDDGSILLRDVKPFTIVSRKEFVEEGTYRKYYRLQLYRECDEFTENFKREGLNDAVFYTWPVELAPDVKDRLFEFDYWTVRSDEGGNYVLAPISVYSIEPDSIKILKEWTAESTAKEEADRKLDIVWERGRPYLKMPISDEKIASGADTTVVLTMRNTYFDSYYIFNDQSQVERRDTVKFRVKSMWVNIYDALAEGSDTAFLDVAYNDAAKVINTTVTVGVKPGREVQDWRLERRDFIGGSKYNSHFLLQNANGMYAKVDGDCVSMTFEPDDAAVWIYDNDEKVLRHGVYEFKIGSSGVDSLSRVVPEGGTTITMKNSPYIYTIRLPKGSSTINLDARDMFADVTVGSDTNRVLDVDIVGMDENTKDYTYMADRWDIDGTHIIELPYTSPSDTGIYTYEARILTDSFMLVSMFHVHLVPEEYVWIGTDNNWNNMNNWLAVSDGDSLKTEIGKFLPFRRAKVTIPDSLAHYPTLAPVLEYYDDSYLPFRELNFSVEPSADVVYIEHGGEIARPDLLHYRRVEMDIKHLATMNWTGMTIPLKATYSGDFAFPCLNPLVEMKYPRQTDTKVNWSASYPSGDISVGGKPFAVRVGKVFYDGMTLKETDKPYELGGYGYEYDSKGMKGTDFNNISEYNVKLPTGHAPLYFPRENTCMATYNENTKDIVNECKYQVDRSSGVGRFVFEDADSTVNFDVLNVPANHGFVILANPFCSHLSFDAFCEANEDVLANKSYMLLTGMNPSYDTPVTEDGKLIAPFQSFVVEIGDDKKGKSLVFTPEMSVTNAVVGGSSVLRSARADKKMTVRTVAGTDTTSITLRVSQYGNDGYQEREDIGKLLVENSNAPEMAFRVEGHNLAVNTSHRMPQSLCLQYLSKRTGQVSILIDGIENMDEGTYYLVDKVTGTREEITDKYKYTFASKGKAEDRFFIERDLREDEYDDVYTYISDTVCGLSDYELSDFKEIGYQTYVKNVELTPIRDSVITLTLLRTPVHADTLTVEANKPGGGYTGYGFDVDMPGTYTHEDVDVYGCDSTFTIKVTSKDFVPVSIYRDGSRTPEKRYAATDGSDLDLKGNDVALFDERQLYTSALLNTPNVIVRNGNSYYSKYITLTDGYGFYSPVEFTAKEITYERKPDVYADKNKGWEAIVLPFTADLFRNSGSTDGMPAGNIVPFSNADGGAYGDFWVKGISQIDVNTIATRRPDLPLMEAYMPYIMAIPGDAWGAEYSFIGQTITFGAEQTIVPQTPDKPFNYGEFDAYLVLADTSVTNAFVLNSTTNIFERMDETTVSPFRFYLKSMGSSVRSLRIYDEDDEITLTPQDAVSTRQGFSLFVNDGDVYILSTSAGTADVYDVSARLMIRNVKYGVGVTKVGTLHTGTYIINGEKIILR